MNGPLLGGIEAGGTKFVCAVGTGPDDVRAELRFATTTPEATLAQAIEFFRQAQQEHGPLAAVGIGSFGPVGLDPRRADFGCVTSTPKPGWAGAPVLRIVREALGVPVGFDTDVNGAALGEGLWGAARDCQAFLYLTIGTGIGGGGVLGGTVAEGGRTLQGLVHPEMGHLRLPHDRTADPFAGVCPYHGDCWEGLASGPALLKRWGVPAQDLPAEHPAWTLEIEYLALGLQNLIVTLSPERIVLGGGVMQQEHLWPRLRRRVPEVLAGYVQSPAILEQMETYLVPPQLAGRAGVLGALVLAQRALAR